MVIHYPHFSNFQEAQNTIRRVRAISRRNCFSIEANLASPEGSCVLVETASHLLGDCYIDILVNITGPMFHEIPGDFEAGHWDQSIRRQLNRAILATHTTRPLLSGRSRIVNIGPVLLRPIHGGPSVYDWTKRAVECYTRDWAW